MASHRLTDARSNNRAAECAIRRRAVLRRLAELLPPALRPLLPRAMQRPQVNGARTGRVHGHTRLEGMDSTEGWRSEDGSGWLACGSTRPSFFHAGVWHVPVTRPISPISLCLTHCAAHAVWRRAHLIDAHSHGSAEIWAAIQTKTTSAVASAVRGMRFNTDEQQRTCPRRISQICASDAGTRSPLLARQSAPADPLSSALGDDILLWPGLCHLTSAVQHEDDATSDR